jgi:hypothetical protein
MFGMADKEKVAKINNVDASDRVTIIVNLEQAQTIMDSLELYSRIIMGQFDHIRYLFLDRKFDYEKMDALLHEIKGVVYPELSRNSYHGIFSDVINPTASMAWDIHQCIRYECSWFKYPEGGVTVNFSPPLRSSNQPLCYVDVNGKRKFTPVYGRDV